MNNRKIEAGMAVVVVLSVLCLVYFLFCRAEQKEKLQEAAVQETTNELDRLMWKKFKLYGEKYKYSSDYETYLIMGTDGSGSTDGEREEYVGSMADFLMLAVVNRTEKTYAFLQLNRDTMATINLLDKNGEGEATAEMQLCTAHWYGGTKEESCENTVNAVSKMLGGISIDGYYAIDMEEIGKLNHAIGGVQVTIEDDFSNISPELKKGETITLDDEQAYSFLRSRQGVGDGENTSRMRRHRQYIEGFLMKLKEKMQNDPEIGISIYEQLAEDATTNLSGGLLADLLTALQGGENRGIFEIEGETKIGAHLDDGQEHTEFYFNKNSIVKILKNLYNV